MSVADKYGYKHWPSDHALRRELVSRVYETDFSIHHEIHRESKLICADLPHAIQGSDENRVMMDLANGLFAQGVLFVTADGRTLDEAYCTVEDDGGDVGPRVFLTAGDTLKRMCLLKQPADIYPFIDKDIIRQVEQGRPLCVPGGVRLTCPSMIRRWYEERLKGSTFNHSLWTARQEGRIERRNAVRALHRIRNPLDWLGYEPPPDPEPDAPEPERFDLI